MSQVWVSSEEMNRHHEAGAHLGGHVNAKAAPGLFRFFVEVHIPRQRAERREPEDAKWAARRARWADIAAGRRPGLLMADWANYDDYDGAGS